jgi:hypothetical protein
MCLDKTAARLSQAKYIYTQPPISDSHLAKSNSTTSASITPSFITSLPLISPAVSVSKLAIMGLPHSSHLIHFTSHPPTTRPPYTPPIFLLGERHRDRGTRLEWNTQARDRLRLFSAAEMLEEWWCVWREVEWVMGRCGGLIWVEVVYW